MKTIENNFSSNLHATVYNYWTYESANKLYDVMQNKITGDVIYMTNSRVTEKGSYHNAIIKHFNLTF
jgi:hypothetical protein